MLLAVCKLSWVRKKLTVITFVNESKTATIHAHGRCQSNIPK